MPVDLLLYALAAALVALFGTLRRGHAVQESHRVTSGHSFSVAAPAAQPVTATRLDRRDRIADAVALQTTTNHYSFAIHIPRAPPRPTAIAPPTSLS